MLRVAVLVSGGGTNLQALLDATARGALPSATLSLVVSNKPEAYALTRARQAGVEAVALPRQPGETPEAYGERLLVVLQAHGAQLVVLAGFLPILAPNVIAAYRDRILNIHPSLIPSFCGEGYNIIGEIADYGLKSRRNEGKYEHNRRNGPCDQNIPQKNQKRERNLQKQ